MKQSNRFRNIVADILQKRTSFGDTQECVEFVMKHDGELKEFGEHIFNTALAETVKSVLRSTRLPENRNVPAFPSIEVDTGEVDEQGEPITKRHYAVMKQMLLSQDWVSMDKVVDAQVKRARSAMSIANATVKAANLRGYQRDLPFPDVDDSADVVG